MDSDHKEIEKSGPDELTHTVFMGKPELVGKSVGCSSLMMKNFDTNANLLKLGMGRAANLGSPQTANRSNLNPVNDDSLSRFISSTIQSNPHAPDAQKPLKDPQKDFGLYTGNSTAIRKAKSSLASPAKTKTSNGTTRRRNSNSCTSEFDNPDTHSLPYKNHMKLGQFNTCTVLNKSISQLPCLMGRNFSTANHTGLPSSNKNLTPIMNSYFTQSSDDRRSRESADFGLLRESSAEKTFTSHEGLEEKPPLSLEASESAEYTSSSQYYSKVFDNSDESLSLLKKMFVSGSSAAARDAAHPPSPDAEEPCSATDKFEWIPPEPAEPSALSTKGDIAELFEDNFEEDCDGYLLSSYSNAAQPDLDVKLMNLSTIHESLYTTSDVATLRTLEKFLLQLLQHRNHYGSLTPFGKLLTFINLTFLKKHITLLDSLYRHPEMAVIRSVLTNSKGQIAKTLNTSAGIEGTKLSAEDTLNVYSQILNKSNREAGVAAAAAAGALKSKQYSSGLRQNKHRLTVIDTLSGMYKPGGEPHFPRFVCGSIDRTLVVHSETISIPFEKSDKRNVHVQFEKFNGDDCKSWPRSTRLPQNICEGTLVQVAPLKHSSLMSWKAGMVVSISAGQLMIKVPNEPKERMYLLRNFVPPNVPLVKMEKGHWRLMPRELEVPTDLYVGSCISLLDLAEPDESVDVVVLNLFFSKENSPIAPVKLPSDETNFQHNSSNDGWNHDLNASYGSNDTQLPYNRMHHDANLNGLDDSLNLDRMDYDGEMSDTESPPRRRPEQELRMCSCNGYTLRVFEGRCAGLPERILVHNLQDKKEHVLNVAELKGFKLNYDIQSHFDGPAGNAQFPNSVWVIPRDISFLGDSLATKDSQKPGYAWLFKPEFCLVMFPFNRSVDTLQDLFRLIPFLHPELNYLALCAGLWSLRNMPELKEREAVSYTRSQKAAIRDLTSNDVVSEVCTDLIRCPFSLTRRLYGCFPVISLWITMDLYDPDNDKEPSIPNNIKVPRPTECEKCGGLVISKTGMVKIICNKYTQMLTKKLTKRSKDTGTNNPSMETLPQVEGDRGKKDARNGLEGSSKPTEGGKSNSNSGTSTTTKTSGTTTKASSSPLIKSANATLTNPNSLSDSSKQPGGKIAVKKEAADPSKDEVGKDRTNGTDRQPEPNHYEAKEDSELRKEMEELSKALHSNPDDLVLGDLDQDSDLEKMQDTSLFNALFSSDAEYDVSPVLCDLERAEEWVKRIQTLANSRWRVTKEFTASYSVDDEFSILTTSPTTTANKPNADFLIQLAGVMNNIRKGKDYPVDPSLVYKLYQLSEECSSTTEGALLTGWSSYILNEQKSQMELLLSSGLHGQAAAHYPHAVRRDKDGPVSGACPLNFNCPRGSSCPCATGMVGSCPFGAAHSVGAGRQAYHQLAPNHIKNLPSPAKNQLMNRTIPKCPVDLSTNYTQLLNNNPILTDLSNFYKRKRDDDIKKLTAFNKMQKNNHASGSLMPKLGLQADVSLLKSMSKSGEKEAQFITDPFDFCKFTDKPQRKKFVSSLKWDEDVEF